MPNIDQPVPKYYKIYKELLQQIRSSQFQEYDLFYSDTELVEKYGVSRGTIREAVKLLIQQGYLVREQGRGTFVTKPKIEQDSKKLMGFTELMEKNGMSPSAKVVKKKIVDAPMKLIKLMQLDEGDKVVQLVRVRFGNDEPLIVEQSYFVNDYFQPIYEMDLESNSIYQLLYNYTNTRLGEARQQISAIRAENPENELLSVDLGTPLLLMKRLIKTKENQFFQYSEDLYRSDRINFVTNTNPYDQYHDNHGVPLGLDKNGW